MKLMARLTSRWTMVEPASPRVAAPEGLRVGSLAVESVRPAKFQGFFSVILPAMNEGHIIEKTLKELTAELDLCVADYEVIVVDDGSTDDTFVAASRFANQDPRINVLAYPENQGKGYALRQGFNASRGDIVIFYDADLDIPPACIQALLEILNANDLGGVVGSRMHRDSDDHRSLKRKFLSHAVHIFVWTLFRISVKDTQVGLKVFRRQALEPIMGLPRVKGFAFDIELLALARMTGIKIGEAPVRIEYVQQPSTVTVSAVFRALMDAFGIFYRVRIKRIRPYSGR